MAHRESLPLDDQYFIWRGSISPGLAAMRSASAATSFEALGEDLCEGAFAAGGDGNRMIGLA
jgi:hypothetical protein